MLTAIYLNNYLIGKADKVSNIVPDRLLSPEFETFQLFGSEVTP